MIFTVKEKVYNTQTKVFLEEPYEKFRNFVLRNDDSVDLHDEDDNIGGLTVDYGNYNIIWIKEGEYMLESLFHECTHVSNNVADSVCGAESSHGYSEILAYYNSFLIRQVLKRVKVEPVEKAKEETK